MNTRKLFQVLLLLTGEALIVICFLYFGRNLNPKLLTLNIIVTTIIFLLYTIDIIFPLVDFKDKSQQTIGSIGIRWFFTLFYTLIAIGAMVIFNTIKPLDITSQAIIQGIFFFLLSLGLYFTLSSSDKVQEVFLEEKQNRSQVEAMKKATKEVQLKLNQMKDIPADLIIRTTVLQDNLRFISPCNNQEAFDLEINFLNEIKTVQDCLFDTPLNYDRIIENIQNCERIFKERKQSFSN